MPSEALWEREGRDWPNRAASRFVEVAGLRWHVQIMGEGPDLTLLHGAGAATHTWRDLAPLLARRFRVIALDLPGHGFTSTPRDHDLSLPAMARGVTRLLEALSLEPQAIVAHSAGAAIALRMTLDGLARPSAIVAFNGALMPFPGAAGHVFPFLAKVLFLNPFAGAFFAMRADQDGAVERLIRSTGSILDVRGLDLYRRLFRTRRHIEGALGMMASWDLQSLKADMPRLAVPLTLAVGGGDKAVPPSVADEVRALIPAVKIAPMPGLGHLAHEENPGRAARIVEESWDR